MCGIGGHCQKITPPYFVREFEVWVEGMLGWKKLSNGGLLTTELAALDFAREATRWGWMHWAIVEVTPVVRDIGTATRLEGEEI